MITMETDYSDLKGKTVFDFTDEKTAEKYALCNKKEHIRRTRENQWYLVNTLIHYATNTNNICLLREVERQYADCIAKRFNE